MCGIAGLFAPDARPIDRATLAAMTNALAHRGPDGSGLWMDDGIGLGHRRLSIIDVEGSPQPMMSIDHRLIIVFNGEIYNFAELRRELSGLGHHFATAGDTEVILNGWRQWGPGVLDRLNGMFAFALYDQSDHSLTLARDRLGVKPLHYARLANGTIGFASELKGLLESPALRRAIDPHAIEDYFALGYVPDDACLIAGVRKLPAGSWIRLERGKEPSAPTRWWDVDFSHRAPGSAEDHLAELGMRIRDAVRSRMVADVPLGAFLSGGVDSSAVVAMMAEASSTPVQTCSIGFDQASLDESRHAEQVARRYATDHRSRVVGAEDFGLIDTLAAAFDEPFADASALPTYRVCQLARERVTVALSGDGADEAFAGYRRHRFQVAEEHVRGWMPAAIRRPLFTALGRAYPKADWAPRPLRARATLLSLGRDGEAGYARSLGVIPPEMRARLFSHSFRRELQGHRAEDRIVAAMRAAPARDPLDRAQYADLKIWLPGDILTKVDRMSMAVSLEAREPLLDHRLVEFAATLTPSQRLRGGEGKYLLKRAMEPYLPREILYRPKMGFVTPISAWFRGPLRAEGERALDQLAATGWFDPAVLSGVADAHAGGRSDHGRLLWQAVMLERALGRLKL